MAIPTQPGGRGDAEKPFELPDEPYELPEEEEPYELPLEPAKYDLVVLNDDTHTIEYVAWLLSDVLGIEWLEGYWLARKIHTMGQAVVFTGSRKQAERKRTQIVTYGPDPWLEGKDQLTVEMREWIPDER
jgi:ATP-dependent Clp protease adaptor protein ClpS